jgi:nicotinic acid mononucleotide adenylyltransferase
MNGISAAPVKHAFFTFGRFQPPTVGHALLIDTIVAKAEKANGDAYIFVSASKDPKKNPLSIETKLEYLHKMHEDKPITFVDTALCCNNNVVAITKYLIDTLYYTHITMVLGSDRVETFRNLFNKFPDLFAKMSFEKAGSTRTTHTLSNNTSTVSNLSSISGTAMRSYAIQTKTVNDANYRNFRAGVLLGSMTDDDVFALLNEIRKGSRVFPLVNSIQGGSKYIRKTRKSKRT